jgi:membrane fusion protein (multidrug efflux system)
MKKKEIRKISLTAIAAGCLLISGCKNTPPEPQQAAEYSVIKIAATDQTVSSSYSATIRGRQDVEIYPQVSGMLIELRVVEGQRVRNGQILFIIDRIPYEAALATANANVDATRAGVATAQLDFNSKKELLAQSVISEYESQAAENNLLTAKALLAQAEAQALNAANNLSYTEIKSPSDGVAGNLPYRAGTLVSPTMPQPLTTVSDNSEMYVYFSITENQLLNLVRSSGSKEEALKSMPAIELQLNDKTMYDETGAIEAISGVIDPKTGTVSVRGVFPNKKGLLHSGSSGSVILPVYRSNCIVIPQTATYEIQDKVFVYKVVDGKAKSGQITVERVNGGKEYIVNSGLNVGDEIISEGVGLLREDTPVTVKSDK